MQLTRDGAEHFRAALDSSQLLALENALAGIPADRPGTRLSGIPALSRMLAADGPIGHLATPYLGGAARPVRALLFNKTPRQNWALGWHQDRIIAVRERIDTPGFSKWTVKSGLLHVEPPFSILERMLTLRIHLDSVGPDNAPLLIAPGSHRLGRVPEQHIGEAVERLGSRVCLADRGDIWAYATSVLHASEAARQPANRRVLQVDYSADQLPGGLNWSGV